jgi:hypothetical protein
LADYSLWDREIVVVRRKCGKTWGSKAPMAVELTFAEGRALYGLLAETTNDIVVKTDRMGFLVHASPAIERLGFALPQMLFGPHISELAMPGYADALRAELDGVIAGRRTGRWVEFPARMADAR